MGYYSTLPKESKANGPFFRICSLIFYKETGMNQISFRTSVIPVLSFRNYF